MLGGVERVAPQVDERAVVAAVRRDLGVAMEFAANDAQIALRRRLIASPDAASPQPTLPLRIGIEPDAGAGCGLDSNRAGRRTEIDLVRVQVVVVGISASFAARAPRDVSHMELPTTVGRTDHDQLASGRSTPARAGCPGGCRCGPGRPGRSMRSVVNETTYSVHTVPRGFHQIGCMLRTRKPQPPGRIHWSRGKRIARGAGASDSAG